MVELNKEMDEFIEKHLLEFYDLYCEYFTVMEACRSLSEKYNVAITRHHIEGFYKKHFLKTTPKQHLERLMKRRNTTTDRILPNSNYVPLEHKVHMSYKPRPDKRNFGEDH